MKPKTKARVQAEHYIDIQLWHTANYLYDIGRRRRKGWFHPMVAASIFAFFAFEAYLNEVGRQLCPDVWQNERKFFARGKYKGTIGKFNYLAEHTGYGYASGVRPFQTVRHLAQVRDSIAHGKTEIVDIEVSLKRADAVATDTKLSQWGERPFAKQALGDVLVLSNGLMAAATTKFGKYKAGYRSSAFVGVTGSRSIQVVDK